MKLKLRQNDIFHCPEGNHQGILEAVDPPKKRMNKPCQKQVRLRFRISADGDQEYLVGKTFCADLSYGSELYNYLNSWLDGDFDRFLDDDGNIDLDLLIGRKADLLITHVDTGTHDVPFVNIVGIFPLGRLTED